MELPWHVESCPLDHDGPRLVAIPRTITLGTSTLEHTTLKMQHETSYEILTGHIEKILNQYGITLDKFVSTGKSEEELAELRKMQLLERSLMARDLFFCFSLRELVSLLKSLRTGWGPPLELVMKMLNSKFWVMEADVWADLLMICRWANPTFINCKKCGPESAAITTSCNHVVCRSCTFVEWSRDPQNNSCPECEQDVGVVILGTIQQSLKGKAVKRERDADCSDDCDVETRPRKVKCVTGLERVEGSGVTMEALKRKTGVSDNQLDAEVIDYDLHELAHFFDQVESYLYNLKLTDGQQTDIKDLAFRCGTHIAMTEALKLWLQPNPLATFRSLLNVLMDMRRGDVALKLLQYIAKEVTE